MYDTDYLKRTLPYVLKLEFRNIDGSNQVEVFGQLDGRRVIVDLGPTLPQTAEEVGKKILEEFPPTEQEIQHYSMKVLTENDAADDVKLDNDSLDETKQLLEEFAD